MANRFVIRDHQISASSSYERAHLQPHMGRLDNPWGSWCAKKRHRGPQHMQIDLGMYKTLVCKLMVQIICSSLQNTSTFDFFINQASAQNCLSWRKTLILLTWLVGDILKQKLPKCILFSAIGWPLLEIGGVIKLHEKGCELRRKQTEV